MANTLSSTAKTYRRFMLHNIAKSVPEITTVPPGNKVIDNMETLSLELILVGMRIKSPAEAEKLLEVIEVGTGNLPKVATTTQELVNNIDEQHRLLTAQKDNREVIIKEFNKLVDEKDKTLIDIAGLVAPQPKAQEGNAAIKNTLETKRKLVNNLNIKVVRAGDQVDALLDSTQDLGKMYTKISGVNIKDAASAARTPTAPTQYQSAGL